MSIEITDLGGGLFEVIVPRITTEKYLDNLRDLKAKGLSPDVIDKQIAQAEKRLLLETQINDLQKQIKVLEKELAATYQ